MWCHSLLILTVCQGLKIYFTKMTYSKQRIIDQDKLYGQSVD